MSSIGLILTDKDLSLTYQSLLLVEFEWPDGTIYRVCTHALRALEGGFQYRGVDWEPRVLNQQIAATQAMSESGIDIVPNVTVEMADPDRNVFGTYEMLKGFKGATMRLMFVFHDLGTTSTGAFSSDLVAPVKFVGKCEPAQLSDERTISVQAVSLMNMSRAQVPTVRIQKRCPWVFPATHAQRVEGALDSDSLFFQCGYSPDVTDDDGPGGSDEARGNYESGTAAFVSCSFTFDACVMRLGAESPPPLVSKIDQDSLGRTTGRFGGFSFEPNKQGGKSRGFLSGKFEDIQNVGVNESRYGDYVPLVYGTSWVDAKVLSVQGDANKTAFEALVCFGKVDRIRKVVVNDHLVPKLADTVATGLYRGGTRIPPPSLDIDSVEITNTFDFSYWRTVNAGTRNGRSDKEAFYDGKGDPYGSMCVLYVEVPRQLISSEQVPRVRILCDGPVVRTYFFDEELMDYVFASSFSDNPAWIIMDLLRFSSWRYESMDVPSFVAASIIFEANIEYWNIDGTKTSTYPPYGEGGEDYRRFSLSYALSQRRSVKEVLRSFLNACKSYLYVTDEGKIAISTKGPLAEQQKTVVLGSNHVDPVASFFYSQAAADGYVAYEFDDSNILMEGEQSSLKVSQKNGSEAPNQVTVEIQNRENEYSFDSITVVDSEDVGRVGSRIPGSIPLDGINTFDHARRAMATWVAENYRGNPRLAIDGSVVGDSGGTLSFEFKTTFRAVHLRVGDLCWLSSTHLGIVRQLVRISMIRPAMNFETVTIVADWHSEYWYLDTFGQEGQPKYAPRFRDTLARPSFPWLAYKQQAVEFDAMFSETTWTFSMRQYYEPLADGSFIAKVEMGGILPVNVPNVDPGPPRLDPIAVVASDSGGVFLGDTTYYVAISSKSNTDSEGYLMSPLSNVASVHVPDGTDTNVIAVNVPFWDEGTLGFAVFIGKYPDKLSFQYEKNGATPTILLIDSSELDEYQDQSWGPPDVELDTIKFKMRTVAHSGPWGQGILEASPGSLKIAVFHNYGFDENQFAGRVVSVIGILAKADGSVSYVPVADWRVQSNDADTLTLEAGDPSTAVDGNPLEVGDVVVMRFAFERGSDETGHFIEDPELINALNPIFKQYVIRSVTNASPVVVSIEGDEFPFEDGWTVVVQGVLGTDSANGGFIIQNVDSVAKTFELTDRNTGSPIAGDGDYEGGGWAARQTRGLNVDEETGRFLRILSGTGAGTKARIKSNTDVRIYIDGDWQTDPDESSVFIIEEPVEQESKSATRIDNESALDEGTFTIDVANYFRKTMLIEPVTMDGSGNESFAFLNPVRELYVFGNASSNILRQENVTFVLLEDPLTDGEDKPDNWYESDIPIGFHYEPVFVSVNAKTAPASDDFIGDIKYSEDGGVVWTSIFPSGDVNKLILDMDAAQRTAPLAAFASTPLEIPRGALFTCDVVQNGGAGRLTMQLRLNVVEDG